MSLSKKNILQSLTASFNKIDAEITCEEIVYKGVHLIFNNLDYIDPVLEVLETLSPSTTWVRVNHECIQLLPEEQAELLEQKIKKSMRDTSEALLVSDSGDGWYQRYLAEKDFGIDHCMISREVSQKTDLTAFLQARQAKDNMPTYYAAKAAMHHQALTYSDNDFSTDLGAFLYANWDGFESLQHATDFASQITSINTRLMKGAPLKIASDNDDIIKAIGDKLEILNGEHTLEIYTLFSNTRRDFNNDYHNAWNDVVHTCLTTVQENEDINTIKPKNYAAMSDDFYPDEHLNITDFTLFNGIDFSHERAYDLNERLHPAYLVYGDLEQGRGNMVEQLIGAVSAVQFELAHARFDERLYAELLALSDTVAMGDTSEIASNITEIIKREMSNAYTAKSPEIVKTPSI
mgnify:CR=1 FL=1